MSGPLSKELFVTYRVKAYDGGELTLSENYLREWVTVRTRQKNGIATECNITYEQFRAICNLRDRIRKPESGEGE